MTTCNLSIQLDEPSKIRRGGDVVTGVVTIRCEKDTNCKGLVVSTTWATHGRGNIDTGIGEESTLFEGMWQAGQEYKYPYSLKSAAWPPTHWGTYVNVAHRVEARAKLAWATDPRGSIEFPVVVTESPLDLQPTRKKATGGVFGYLILCIVCVLIAIFAIAFWWLIPIVGVCAGVYWFFKSFLPRQLTGSAQTTLEPKRLRAGQSAKGTLVFTPRRSAKINGVRYELKGIERCVSGSGSNRKTHTHEIHKVVGELAGARQLKAGLEQRFEFDVQLPSGAAPSMKLVDNEISWTVEYRIDIPNWPDWSEVQTLVVEPSEGGAAEMQQMDSRQALSEEDAWLDQVIEQLETSTDAERLGLVLEAIRQHEFTMLLQIESGELDEEYKTRFVPNTSGQWFEAYDQRRDLVIAMFVPSGLLRPTIGAQWQGKVHIVDYSADDETIFVMAI